MATALNIKRKNIDLPVETLQKLSIMAAAHGRSLKNYIETILINKANSISVEVSENPRPQVTCGLTIHKIWNRYSAASRK